MEISYKYIVFILVILAIICVMVTIENYKNKDEIEYEENNIENFTNSNTSYVATDSILKFMTEVRIKMR